MKIICEFISSRINTVITIIFVLFFMQSLCAAASLPDIGMITMIKGEITYWNTSIKEKAKPAQSFMKVRPDDEFKLTPDSELQLIFFSSGRKEIWKGPAELILSESMGQLTGANKKNNKLQIIRLPAAVVNEVRRISPLIDPTKLHRSGSFAIRGVGKMEKIPFEKLSLKSAVLDIEEKEEINSVKDTYLDLIKSSPPDDITPELYLFSIMADYEQFNDIKQLIKKMKEKQPDNPGVEQLVEWLRNQAEKQKGERNEPSSSP